MLSGLPAWWGKGKKRRFVAAGAQCEGIGTALPGLGEGTSKGMLTVGAYEENAHARAFYRRGGFEEIGSREDELTGSREYWTEWKGESI